MSIPAITPDFYLAIGPQAPLLPYITPTTQALADAVAAQVVDHDAILLRNHGLVVVADSTDSALRKVLLVEEVARIVLLAHAARVNARRLRLNKSMNWNEDRPLSTPA